MARHMNGQKFVCAQVDVHVALVFLLVRWKSVYTIRLGEAWLTSHR